LKLGTSQTRACHPANDYRVSRDYEHSGIPMISVGSLLFVIAPIMALFSAAAPQGTIVNREGPPSPSGAGDSREFASTRYVADRLRGASHEEADGMGDLFVKSVRY